MFRILTDGCYVAIEGLLVLNTLWPKGLLFHKETPILVVQPALSSKTMDTDYTDKTRTRVSIRHMRMFRRIVIMRLDSTAPRQIPTQAISLDHA